jgi:DNA topoisomerase-3
MKLYICEKYSVGQALADALPGEKKKDSLCAPFLWCGHDIVAWASGHLLELREPEEYDPAYKKWNRDTLLYVPERWSLRAKNRGKDLLNALRKAIAALDGADTVVNAGDADREGQLLIDEILDYLGWKGQTLRLRINDTNPGAIRKALSNMRDNSEYLGEYRAGQARHYADWLVGLAMTRYVTVSLRDAGYKANVMSAGRVQTPTLGLVVRRDSEIQNFTPYPYYAISAVLSLDGGRKIKGRWVPKEADEERLDEGKRLTDREFADELVQRLSGLPGTVGQVTKKEHRVPPPLPYSLSKLQMAASKKYDITDTLAHAQKLYEAGYITYPRTGCGHIPEDHFAEAADVMDAIRAACPSMSDMLAGADLSRKSPAWDDKKITEHHAIIPTARIPLDGALTDTERKIYELVCARYALQFLAYYEYEETAAEFCAGGETFRAAGRTVTIPGWQGWEKDDTQEEGKKSGSGEADGGEDDDGRQDSQMLPDVRQGEEGILSPSSEEKVTKPPKPYTYHALLAAMNSIHTYVKDPGIRAKLKEVQGIGTEATQEGIISTLFGRGYIEKTKKAIQATGLGRMLIDILSGGKSEAVTRPDMTALWESAMSDIEAGKASLESFVDDVAGMVREIIAEPLNVPEGITGLERRAVAGEAVEAPCPLGCGKQARRYEGKFGPFWKCSCSPDATFKDVDGVPVVKEARAGAECPVKGCKGKALYFVSKKDNRPFWKCPKCGNYFDDDGGTPAVREAKGAGETHKEAACPVKGCKGKALYFVSKKDGRPFWRCQKCGSYFDDGEGKPVVRGETRGEDKKK